MVCKYFLGSFPQWRIIFEILVPISKDGERSWVEGIVFRRSPNLLRTVHKCQKNCYSKNSLTGIIHFHITLVFVIRVLSVHCKSTHVTSQRVFSVCAIWCNYTPLYGLFSRMKCKKVTCFNSKRIDNSSFMRVNFDESSTESWKNEFLYFLIF